MSENYNAALIGRRVLEKRVRKGMTQKGLAEKIKMSPRTIQRIESGETNTPVYTLAEIAMALNCTFAELLSS